MCLQAYGVTLGVVMCRSRSWTLIILGVPFQTRIFYDSMKKYSQVGFFLVDSVSVSYNLSMAVTVVSIRSVQ